MTPKSIVIGLAGALIVGLLVRDLIVEPDGPWYWGGTLHWNDGDAWMAASKADRLATAGDLTAGYKGADRKSREAMDAIKGEAESVVACIDRRAVEKGYVPVSRLSFLCMEELKIPGRS